MLIIHTTIAAGTARPELQADEKTISYLNTFRADYIKSMKGQHPDKLQTYYAQNIRLMPDFQNTVMGKTHALTYHKAFSSRFSVGEYTREALETLDLGSQVVEVGMFTMLVTLKSSGKGYDLKGKYLNLWEKAENGKLTLITDAWNYNHQVEIAQQLKFEQVPAIQMAYQPHLPVNNAISFELAALSRLMEVAFTQHDARLMSQFYTDDASFIYSYNPIYKGRQQIDAFLEQHMKEMPIFEKLDCRNDRIDLTGEYVIEYASHIANWRNGEYSGVNTGKNLRIWKRGKEGSLKIFRQIAMYD
jgi:ketosteroid isomerase-like protein